MRCGARTILEVSEGASFWKRWRQVWTQMLRALQARVIGQVIGYVIDLPENAPTIAAVRIRSPNRGLDART